MAPAVEAAALPGLDAKVDSYLDSLMTAAPRSPEFAAKATDVRTMGDGDIRRAAETSNRLLKSPVKALQEGGLAEGSKVGTTLLELRRTIEELDPKEATGAKKFLGLVPFGERVTDYFRKYQSAQSHLDGILHALRDGQDELGKDNAALNLTGSPGSQGDQFGQEAVDTLVKEMEDRRDDLVVIVAGYPAPMEAFIAANPGLASRFRTIIEFEDYTDDELVAILTNLAKGADYELLPEAVERFREVLGRTPRGSSFGNGRFARNALEAAIGHHAWRLRAVESPTIDQLRRLVATDFDEEPLEEGAEVPAPASHGLLAPAAPDSRERAPHTGGTS